MATHGGPDNTDPLDTDTDDLTTQPPLSEALNAANAVPIPDLPPPPASPSDAITGKHQVVPRQPTQAYDAGAQKPVIAPKPRQDSLHSGFLAAGPTAARATAFDRVKYGIAKRNGAHFVDTNGFSHENSTIFLSVLMETNMGNLSRVEAEILLKEYFDTLSDKEKAPVFMDILTAESNGILTKKDAGSIVKTLNLSDCDKEIFEGPFERLTGEKSPQHVPDYTPAENFVPQNANKIPRWLTGKIALATYAVAALGAVAGVSYKFRNTESPAAKGEKAPAVHVAETPNTVAVETAKKQAAVIKKPEIAPVVSAPIKAPTPAPKRAPVKLADLVAHYNPAPAPVAAPRPAPTTHAEVQASITLPLLTRSNGHGGTGFDEAKSKEAWVSLGYAVTAKSDEAGKKFYELKASNGTVYVVKVFSIEKGQSSIEAKKQ